MSTNDTGTRRASPFARGPVADAAAAKESPKAAPASGEPATAPTAATTGGRASPFASRAAAPAAPDETKAPAATAAPTTGRSGFRSVGSTATPAAPSAAPSAAPTATTQPPANRLGAARGATPAAAPAKRRPPAAQRRERTRKALPPMPTTLPGTVDVKVTNLLFAMSQLVIVLTEENAALDRHDAGSVRAMMENKMLKTRYYQEQMLAVHTNPRLLLDLNEEQRAVMRTAAGILDSLAKENGLKLKANIEATNRFMKAVVTAVSERERERATSYSKGGEVEGDPTQAFRKSVTFNETL
jgi:hypothetical protein